MSNSLLQPEEHVLSTMERDGSRRWLKPRLSRGKLLERRRWFAYLLIAVFTILPFITVNKEPLFLLDIMSRRFTIFGFTFLPTDTVLLAIFVVGVLMTIFLLTALFGRVWCGWACPQTVYMEFLFRPIERFFDGTTGRGGKPRKFAGWRMAAKYLVFFLVCVYLANTFLAYFVGVKQLWAWVRQSPIEHPVPFLVMALVTFAMMFDFCFFREQMCLVACPYGRFQSVLLDQNSLIVAYDQTRGEPRGKRVKKTDDASSLPVVGDCIDCGNCVTTCPTGIDIRQGLQMECINCTQCIDACNLVMAKIGRAPNLVRYSSQSRDQGKLGSLIRARTMIYPILLLGILTAFITVFLAGKTFDAVILRETGNPFTLTDDGQIRNVMRLKLTNRENLPATYTARIVSPESAVLEIREGSMPLKPNESRAFHISVVAPRDEFPIGTADLKLEVKDAKQVTRILNFKLIGP